MTDGWTPVAPDIGAERCTLGSSILSPSAAAEAAEIVSREDFTLDAHQKTWDAITEMRRRGEPVDPMSITIELRKRKAFVGKFDELTISDLVSSTPTAANVAVYAKRVAEIGALRRLDDEFIRGQQRIRQPDVDLGEVLDQVRETVDVESRLAKAGGAPSWASGLVAGGAFILDAPPLPRAIWGRGDEIAWADGEALMIGGPPGVGKTTLVVQLVAGRLGIVVKDVLGLPVQPGERRVLYLAMDRPPQISRAMARVFGTEHRATLEERLVVWKGPPPADFARNTGLLAEMCQQAGADTVIVDSLKDAVLKLSDDESGSGYNRARQRALVEGVQVVELHHQRKAAGDNKKPTKLDDVYGSTWITAGAGSVILLWGQAGDPVVEFLHLKQPVEPLGPWRIIHDHGTGLSEIYHQADLLQMVRHQGRVGLTPKLAASAMFSTDKPSASEIEKARRRLNKYVDDGYLALRPGARGGATAAYFLVLDERAGGAR